VVFGSTQEPPQAICPAGQEVAHAPFEQTSFAPQAFPHLPQFDGSTAGSTQRSVQRRAPSLQTKSQAPLVQIAAASAGASQALSHAPQRFVSEARSAQALSHLESPLSHENPQTPPAHEGIEPLGAVQAVEQPPQ
jgi:hypothetical protein